MDIFSTIQITFVPCLFSIAFSWRLNTECDNCGCCDAGKDLCLHRNLNCTTCLDGYWGEICRNSCPASCLACMKDPRRLSFGTNTCTKCEAGKYLDHDFLGFNCRQCPSTCKTCTSFNICKECKTGYYLNNSRCIQCNPNCTACLSYAVCISCISAHYGNNCEKCSVGCEDNVCNNNTGACTCKTTFNGQKCDQCVKTFYGQNCDLNCSTICKDQICFRDTGICEHCVHGWYGEFCNQSCSRGCKSGICDRDDGNCIDECLHAYSDKDSNMVTFEEFVKKTALAVVVTFTLSLCVTVAVQCIIRFIRRRRINRNIHTEETTVESYATLSSSQTNTEREYAMINRDNDFINPRV